MLTTQSRYLSVYDEACAAAGCDAETTVYLEDGDIYQAHAAEAEMFMFDLADSYVLPQRFSGSVRHTLNEWSVFGGAEESRRFFVHKIAAAEYPFNQAGVAGYLGMGPGVAADYYDQRKWSIDMQLKKQRKTEELVTALYTCDT